MRRLLTALCLLLLLPGAILAAEETVSPYRWTVGYESGSIMLRRFIGQDWEVFLGGWVDMAKNDSPTLESRLYTEPNLDLLLISSFRTNTWESSNSSIVLGTGRTIMRADRFWLNATLGLRYYWESRYSSYFNENPQSDEALSTREDYSQTNYRIFGCSLGLRPAFDLSSRITVAMGFGVRFQRTEMIKDTVNRYVYFSDDGSVIRQTTNTDRDSSNGDTINVFGSTGINSLSFIFRF